MFPSVFPHNSLQLCSTNFSCGLRGGHGEYTVMQKNMLSPKFIGLTIKPPHFPPSPSLNTFNWSQKPTNQKKKKSVENVKWSCTLGLHSWVLKVYLLNLKNTKKIYFADLVPRQIVDQWLKYLCNEFPTIAFKASTQNQRQNLVSN